MRRSWLRSAAVVMTAGAMVALGTSSALAGTSPATQVINVVGNGSSVQLSANSAKAGNIRFNLSTTVSPYKGGSEIGMFRLKAGKTLNDVLRALGEEFGNSPSVAAKGTRDLTKAATFLGLADVVKGYPMAVTESLTAGRYYLADMGTSAPSLRSLVPFTVRSGYPSSSAQPAMASQFTVKMTSDDRFVAPRDWSHKGTVTVANVSDTLHFMNLVPVKRGTTDAQIQKYFDSGVQAPPPFALNGVSEGSDVQSPGTSLKLTYNLPAGTYALLCFVADDVTGMPHAVMGMHKVVVLH